MRYLVIRSNKEIKDQDFAMCLISYTRHQVVRMYYVVCMYVCYMVITYSTSMDGKVANPARGQLNRKKNEYFPVHVRA